ncbi:MAG: hypothetical protein MRY83_22510 [Flavobacteriales bacterium]|nr:hypothetical protein [Flavobacteriales bacterium]
MNKAASSFSSFTKQNITVDIKSVFESSKVSDDVRLSKQGAELILISTEIKGGIEGQAFLLLSDKEAKSITDPILKKDSYKDPTAHQIMVEAFLSELDNIVTAAAITELSNILRMECYGHIPVYFKGSREDVQDKIHGMIKNENFEFKVKIKFISDKDKIGPDFIWYLSPSFMSYFQKFVSAEMSENELKKLMH